MRGFPFSSRQGKEKPPWSKREYSGDVFDDELKDFVEWLTPSENESYVRKCLIWRYTMIIEKIFPGSTVTIQGSFATGTYLSLSDIDIVIFGEIADVSSALTRIKFEFEKYNMIDHGKVIASAKVPIVTVIDKVSKIPVDISIGHYSGLMAVIRITKYLQAYPNLKPLICFVKVFTKMNRLDVPFHGGFGSCHLIHLCIFVIQKNPTAKTAGELIKRFLEFVGTELNSNKVGISVNQAPHYFNKKDRGVFTEKVPDALVVQDSTDRNGYLGLYSSKTSEFRERCKSALSIMKMSANANTSALATLFRDLSVFSKRKEEFDACAEMIRSGAMNLECIMKRSRSMPVK